MNVKFPLYIAYVINFFLFLYQYSIYTSVDPKKLTKEGIGFILNHLAYSIYIFIFLLVVHTIVNTIIYTSKGYIDPELEKEPKKEPV